MGRNATHRKYESDHFEYCQVFNKIKEDFGSCQQSLFYTFITDVNEKSDLIKKQVVKGVSSQY